MRFTGNGSGEQPARAAQRFYKVSEVAAILRVDQMTVYRAITAGEFPAVRIRRRLVVPVKVIDAMVDAAMSTGALVDAADWVPETGVV